MGSLLWIVAALGLVLGGLLLLLRLLARASRGMARVAGSPDLEVLSRVGLAPRQGAALVRARGRTLLLSVGDGGVRLLAELDGEPPEKEGGPPPAEAADATPARRFARNGFAERLRRLGVLAWILALPLGAFGAGGLSAQDAPPTGAPPTAEQEAPPDLFDAPLPPFEFELGGSEEGEPLRVSGTVGVVLFIGFLTLLPTLLLLTTSFTRILVVLHLLKQALGTQTAPPAHLLAALALLLTAFVMGPTLAEVNDVALVPWMEGEVDEAEMFRAGSVPVREFMLGVTREEDLVRLLEMRDEPPPGSMEEVSTIVLMTAFVTTELRNAFQMGFALFLPFLVIDLVVASVLMSMGMFMLPPVMVSLPFKLLLFVLVDGWSLVVGSLLQSFH